MANIYCQVTFPARSLFTADNAVNTFHFTGVGDAEDVALIAQPRIRDFYNAVSFAGVPIVKNFLSSELQPEGARLKAYDLSDPEPRVPVLDMALGVTSATPIAALNLPGEVSVAASYSAAVVSGQSRARRRGRIFLGPLNNGATTTTANVPARPSTGVITSLVQASKVLAAANSDICSWMVWSRVNQSGAVIIGGHVDNAFDVQRRRGVAATARNAWNDETP